MDCFIYTSHEWRSYFFCVLSRPYLFLFYSLINNCLNWCIMRHILAIMQSWRVQKSLFIKSSMYNIIIVDNIISKFGSWFIFHMILSIKMKYLTPISLTFVVLGPSMVYLVCPVVSQHHSINYPNPDYLCFLGKNLCLCHNKLPFLHLRKRLSPRIYKNENLKFTFPLESVLPFRCFVEYCLWEGCETSPNGPAGMNSARFCWNTGEYHHETRKNSSTLTVILHFCHSI